MDPNSGYQCPEGTTCVKLKDSRYKLGFNGFDEIGKLSRMFISLKVQKIVSSFPNLTI